MKPSRAVIKMMQVQDRAYPVDSLVEIPRDEWPAVPPPRLVRALRSRYFMVQVYDEPGGVIRLSIHRCQLDGKSNRWKDGISWDELQTLKALAGYADRVGVELYPSEADVVNVANIRHIFLLTEAPAFMWKRSRTNNGGR